MRLHPALHSLLRVIYAAAACLLTDAVFGGAFVGAVARYGVVSAVLLMLLPCLCAIVLTWVLARLGNVLAAALCGWRVEEVSILGFGLHRREDGRLCLMYRRPVERVTAIATPPVLDGSCPVLPWQVGGMLLCGVIALAATGLALLWRPAPWAPLLFLGGVYTLGMLLFALPGAGQRRGLLDQLRLYAREQELRRALTHRLCVAAANRRGVSVSELPEELFVPYPAELWTEPNVFTAMSNRATRLLNAGQYEEARETLSGLMSTLGKPALRIPRKEITSHFLACSLSIAEVMTGTVSDCSARLDTPEMQRSLSHPGWQERLLLARYVRALLVQRDQAAAEALLRELTPRLSALEPARVAGTRAILRDAQALAIKTNTQEENP